MKNKYILWPLIFLLPVFFIACEDEDLGSSIGDSIVLEGYLYGGHAVSSIWLSSVISGEQTTALPIEDAQGLVWYQDKAYPLVPLEDGSGNYKNEELLIENGQYYTIEIEALGKQLTAETYVPEKPELSISKEEVYLESITGSGGFPGGTDSEQVEISWENTDESYYYVVIDNMESDPEYVNQIFIPEEEGPYHRATDPEIKDIEVIDSRRGMPQYGLYRVVVFKVNAEYAALFEDTGDSSQSLSEPVSNVENGLGVFTGVSSDTIFFEVKKQ